MKLRARLALTLVALIVPFGVALALTQVAWERRALEDRIYARTLAYMDAGGRERCEADPARFRGDTRRHHHRDHGPRGPHGGSHAGSQGEGPPRGPRGASRDVLFAFDAAYRPARPGAPRLSQELVGAIEGGESVAIARRRGPRDVEALVAMPWDDGPCARLLVRTAQRDAPLRLLPSVLVAACVALIALLAVGPLIRRIRRLTASVERAAHEPDAPIAVDGHDELAELGHALERSRAQLAEQLSELTRRERALRDYVANTTHDLMLPLSVLQGYLTSLERSLPAGADPARGALHSALEESHYLASMVQNLAAAARLEAGVPETSMSEVDLTALVVRVADRHRRIAQQRGIELAYAVPEHAPTMRGDLTLLEQALSNLVHNAVRYGHHGGHVAIILEVSGDELSLRVLDDGPGVPQAQLARITERGYRGDQARTRGTLAGGLGLGLFIVSDVAARHGLTLRLEPGEEGGLVAELRGPLRRG